MNIRRLLVLGGTGFVGRALCEHWVRHAGGSAGITVPTRSLRQGQALQMLPGVELVRADVLDERQLARLVAGQDAVVNLVARLHGREAEFQRLHVELPRRLAQACRQAGVRRLVHVSALGADAAGPSMYLRSKAGGEAALQQAGLELTLLRPSVIFGAGDRFINLFARLQALFPVLPLGGAHARFQPVWVRDVAEAIVQSLARREAIGQVYECTGPGIYTLAELVRLAGRWAGHPRPIVPLPDALARLQATLMQVLPGEPLLSRDNLDSMRVDSVAGGKLPGLQALGITPAALESVMPAVLGPDPLDTRRRGAGH